MLRPPRVRGAAALIQVRLLVHGKLRRCGLECHISRGRVIDYNQYTVTTTSTIVYTWLDDIDHSMYDVFLHSCNCKFTFRSDERAERVGDEWCWEISDSIANGGRHGAPDSLPGAVFPD